MKNLLLSIVVATAWTVAFQFDTVAAAKFKRIMANQIGATLTGMELSDRVHWRYIFNAHGALINYSTGHKRIGKWRVDGNELCLHLEGEPENCYEVWLSGTDVELRNEYSD